MKKLFFLILLISTVSCSSDGGENNANSQIKDFDIAIEVDLAEDLGQGLGTLFSATDSEGRVILEAGFQDSYSTYIRDNNRMLAFYYKKENIPIQIEAIGKPFESYVNAARLIADQGVFAFYYDDPLQADKNFGIAADWMPKGLFGLQHIADKRLLLVDDFSIGPDLILDNKIIYSPGEDFLFYFSKGIVAVFHYNPSRIYIGFQDITQNPLIDLSKLDNFSIQGIPFIFGTYNNELIFGTNAGAIYSYEDGQVNIVRENDGTSFQIYSAVTVNDRLILGHYPSGSIYVYDNNGLHEFEHPIPVPVNANIYQREAQTLCIFNGELYVGLWPWGELWRFNFDENKWYFVDRLFYIPEMSTDVTSPYESEMAALGDEYNYWGQRISSMIPFGDSLYISTMNKRGLPYLPEVHSFLSEEAVEQYGQIHRLSGPFQITSFINWRSKTTFRFKIESKKMSIFQDGELLQEVENDAPLDGLEEIETITLGKGIYGEFGGAQIIGYERIK